ncbi:DNA primase [Pelagibaculum spongiae]|uniref:DNA primase n=1 Tax=Pelagibaculum spongiae TaxID=2080658 RepID=UPI00131417E3|nr:DNA primase [Pelagibaculum spongiae]
MAGRIPQSFIDDLLARTDLVELIRSRVRLKKAGKNYSGLCPFHDEKSPSFSVIQDKQFYYCFGCGASGNAVSFLMDYERLEFVDAIEDLAHQSGLEVPREEGSQQHDQGHQPLYNALELSKRFYQAQLSRHDEGKRGIEYLKQRGLSGEIARDFALGYSLEGWDNLIKAIKPHSSIQQMEQAGLVINKEGTDRFYDRFRGRIMFPIRNHRGRVIAFGGRILGDGKPKYLNSPETPVFQKGNELYGLYEAKKANRSLEELLIVEGYMDVVALFQLGIPRAVATLGTACTRDHAKKLFRAVNRLVFCFDGDDAGRNAAWRALENILPELHDGRQAHFMFLDQGEDPDTLVRKIGKEAFEQEIKQSRSLVDYLFEALSQQTDINSMDGRARLSELAKPLIAKVPGQVLKQLMLEKLSQMVGITTEKLERAIQQKPADLGYGKRGGSQYDQYGSSKSAIPTRSQNADYPDHYFEVPPATDDYPGQAFDPSVPAASVKIPRGAIRSALQSLLQKPELALQLTDTKFLELLLQHPGCQLLDELIQQFHNQPAISLPSLIEQWRGRSEAPLLMQLSARSPLLPENDPSVEFRDAIQQLHQQALDAQTEQLLQLSRSRPLQDNERILLKQLLENRASRG